VSKRAGGQLLVAESLVTKNAIASLAQSLGNATICCCGISSKVTFCTSTCRYRLDGYDLCGEAADVLTASAIVIDDGEEAVSYCS